MNPHTEAWKANTRAEQEERTAVVDSEGGWGGMAYAIPPPRTIVDYGRYLGWCQRGVLAGAALVWVAGDMIPVSFQVAAFKTTVVVLFSLAGDGWRYFRRHTSAHSESLKAVKSEVSRLAAETEKLRSLLNPLVVNAKAS